MKWKRKTLILAVLFGLLMVSESNGQRFWRMNATTRTTTNPCVNGNCPTTNKAVLKVEEKTQPVVTSEVAENVAGNVNGLESSVPDVEKTAGEIDPMRAECILRGETVVNTSLYAAGDDFVRAASLPDDEHEKCYCLLFHKTSDAESKALLEDWKKTEKLRVLADPVVPKSVATKCQLVTVNVDDVTQQDLIQKYHVHRTPCVIVLSPSEDFQGMSGKTLLCRLEGYDGQPEVYANRLLTAFRQGLFKAIHREGVQAGRFRPKITPTTTLEQDEIMPQAGLDVNIVVPEELSQSVDSLGEKLLRGFYIMGGCLLVLFGVIPLIIKGLPIVWKALLSVWEWYKSVLFPTPKAVTEDTNTAAMATLLAKIEQLEAKLENQKSTDNT